MERMGDILAKSATRRAGQRIARSAATTTPASGTPAAGQPAGRIARGAITTPLSRRAGTRARTLSQPHADAAEPAPASPPTSASPGADVYPLVGAQPPTDTLPTDALPADRILELPPRRASFLGPRQPTALPARAEASAMPPARPARMADGTPARHVVRVGQEPAPRRRGAAAAAGGMLPLREVAATYLSTRPGEEKGGAAHTRRAAATPARRAAGSAASVCPQCGGTGFLRLDVPLGDPSFGQAVPCACKERLKEEQRRSDLRRLSSLDPFIDKTFETFEPRWMAGVEEAFRAAREFAAEPRGWLVLRGGYGVGKTHLAAAIANFRLAAGSPVFFSIVPDLLDHLRAAFAPTSEITYDAMFDRIREVELLVLDDLGAENGTAWASEKLFQLINYRYNFRMPTVITTNNRLLSHMDDRISSRLSDLSLVRNIMIEAQDYRRRHIAGAPRATGGGGTAGRGGSSSGGTPTRGRGYAR
jgi:DNA replication protein DnaC